MHCFRHPETHAVGICRACNKGLCRVCAVELNFGLACPNSCEDRVELLNKIVDNGARSTVVVNSQMRSAGSFLVIMGGILAAFGAYEFTTRQSPFLAALLVAFGLLFLGFGITRLTAARYPALPDSRRPRA